MSSRAITATLAAALLVLLAGAGLGWSATRAQLAVRTAVDPGTSSFGDLIAADVAIGLDSQTAAKARLRVQPDFSPFVLIGRPTITRSRAGDEETTHYRYVLQCVSADCLPGKQPRKLRFAAVDVSATVGSTVYRSRASWAPLFVSSRLTAADLAHSTPRFRRPATAPPFTFGAPAVLADILTVAAALLAAVALGLLVYEGRRLTQARRRWALENRTPLEVAIAYTRQAARRRDPADRRKALGLLATALAEGHRSELAFATGDAAWGPEPPSPSRALELADRAEPASAKEPA